MGKWSKDVYRLPKNHGWRTRPGYQSFVADRGVLRFDFPADWQFEPSDTSFKFRDREPPDDSCILEVSIFHLTPGVDWTELSLVDLLENATKDDEETLSRGRPVYKRRGDLEIVWQEKHFIDPEERREARSRCCLARRGLIQPLITFAYWPEDAARLLPIWDEVLRSLRVGEYIALPLERGSN